MDWAVRSPRWWRRPRRVGVFDFAALSAVIMNEATGPETLATYDKVAIPYGSTRMGKSWRRPAHAPNLMVVGAPGTGKTSLENGPREYARSGQPSN